MLIASDWKDFELLDTGSGEKLERWGKYVLRRPDPQAIWPKSTDKKQWDEADAWYIRSEDGGGFWSKKNHTRMPKEWNISYKDLKFIIHPTGFKHTGLFPEQAVNWDWMSEKIKNSNRNINVINLFAYTGGATVACASSGAEVCHVDAAKGMVSRAAENIKLSGLEDRKVRFIIDDVFKFVAREQRRGRKYDAIIMDPPSYGRGPSGELWKMEDNIFSFVSECMEILSDEPLFYLINSYTTGLSPSVVENIMRLTIGKRFKKGTISSGETGIPSKAAGIVLPCGSYCRWEA